MKKHLISATVTAGILLTSLVGAASAHENTYNVVSGDSLSKIAKIKSVTVSDLKTWNKLTSDMIYINQSLSLLAPHSHPLTPAGTTVESALFLVKTGDTLWGIAKTNGTSISEIKTLNNLSSDTLFPGQKLLIKGIMVVPSDSTPIDTNHTTSYKVQSGDSLWVIATRYNLSVSQLTSINNLSSDTIYVGQVLKVTGSTTTAPALSAPVSTVSKVEALIQEAKKYIGSPYIWGGNTELGFDCSGYLKFVFNKVGVTIPRTVATIWNATQPISTLKVGDIVFFETSISGPSHAGIYLENNKFIHAGSSTGVTISDMNNSYWESRYLGARSAL